MCSKLYLHTVGTGARNKRSLPLLRKLAKFAFVVRGTIAPLTAFLGIFDRTVGSSIVSKPPSNFVRFERCAMVLNCMHGCNSPFYILPPYVMSEILFLSTFDNKDASNDASNEAFREQMFTKILILVEMARKPVLFIGREHVSRVFEAKVGAKTNLLQLLIEIYARKRRRQ